MNALKINDPERRSSVAPTILVVEDEVVVRLTIVDYLRDSGFRVLEADSADEALEILNDPDSIVDMVFSDVQTPGQMDGFALATWLRSEKPGVRLMLTSGAARAADRPEGVAAPLVEKPYDPEVVERELRAMLANDR